MKMHFFLLFFSVLLVFSCTKTPKQDLVVQKLPHLSHPKLVVFDGVIEFLGSHFMSEEIKRGEKIKADFYFRARKKIEIDYQLFVHHSWPKSKINSFGADHWPVSENYTSSEWKPNEILKDSYEVVVPQDYPDNEIDIYIGFYHGNSRLKIDGFGSNDNRLYITTMKIKNPLFPIPKAIANYTDENVVIDGRIFENTWKNAMPVTLSDSKDNTRFPALTHVRFAWNDSGIFLAWEVHDNDIRASYKNQDDPLYEEEAIEFFINSNQDENDYTELQCAPNETKFDASFHSQRKGMNRGFDSDFVCKVLVQGSINNEGDTDTRWISEWFIPFSEIKDFSSLPKHQTQWNINLFRIDGFIKENTLQKNYLAWSLPIIGDFHNLRRFGVLEFHKEMKK